MKSKIIETVKKFDTIIIHRHVRPDPDAYGSQGGLAEILKTSFPEKNVYVVGEEEESLHFLNRMDNIEDSVYENALVIVCDTANTGRISDQRYNKGNMLIKIDHHPNNDPYGDLIWVDTSYSSVSEMIYELFLEGEDNGLKLNDEGARLIYAGIVGDTGRFLYNNTTLKTFQFAGELLQYNVDFVSIYQKMYEVKPNVAHLQGYVLNNFELTDDGVAFVKLTKDLLKKYDVTPNESSQFVGVLGSIQGVHAWVFFVEEDNEIRVRLRSNGPVINVVAQKYNGGGHKLASGATIYSWNEAEGLIADMNQACRNN